MIPAGERLDCNDLTRRDVHQRLVCHGEFVRAQCRAQVDRQRSDPVGVVQVSRVENCMATGSAVLGAVHCQICPVNQLMPCRIRVGDSDTDAGTEGDGDVLGSEWFRDGAGDVSRDLLRSFHSAHPFADDQEFVPAETSNGVGRARCGHQSLHEFHQRPVSGVVAQAVVDDFEVVDIQQKEGQSIGLKACPSQSGVEDVVGESAIGQPGECVVGAAPSELAFQFHSSKCRGDDTRDGAEERDFLFAIQPCFHTVDREDSPGVSNRSHDRYCHTAAQSELRHRVCTKPAFVAAVAANHWLFVSECVPGHGAVAGRNVPTNTERTARGIHGQVRIGGILEVRDGGVSHTHQRGGSVGGCSQQLRQLGDDCEPTEVGQGFLLLCVSAGGYGIGRHPGTTLFDGVPMPDDRGDDVRSAVRGVNDVCRDHDRNTCTGPVMA
ncbi:unannotated protein [freshwater metagenome]|uniref:Unannotated protein n=1 Tax=freshwater metagenome TaxID=449393 RepID=A0A6J7F9M0_9ZZZZ